MVVLMDVGKGKKIVVVTADDLGLAPEINAGIIAAHDGGVVTAASLLMNAPATAEGVRLAKSRPNLQTGIHLSFVEGFALTGERNTLSDELSYFSSEPERLCLHRHWQDFLKRYFSGRIHPEQVQAELRCQIEAFLRHFPSIPFANGTQHLHLLPGIMQIVLELCHEYEIPWLRLPVTMTQGGAAKTGGRFVRGAQAGLMRRLARIGASSPHVRSGAVRFPDRFLGFSHSGNVSEQVMLNMIDALHAQDSFAVAEIMIHPGYEAAHLRRDLPWAYASFRWEDELSAARSEAVRDRLIAHGFELGGFPDATAKVAP